MVFIGYLYSSLLISCMFMVIDGMNRLIDCIADSMLVRCGTNLIGQPAILTTSDISSSRGGTFSPIGRVAFWVFSKPDWVINGYSKRIEGVTHAASPFTLVCCFLNLLSKTSRLEFMLARWCLDVASMPSFLLRVVILRTDVVLRYLERIIRLGLRSALGTFRDHGLGSIWPISKIRMWFCLCLFPGHVF